MTPAERRALIADLVEVGEINERRRADARRPPPAPLAKAMLDNRPMDIRALVTEAGQLIAYVGKIGSAPLAKARPKPAGRRSAPAPRDWLGRIEADQLAIQADLVRAKLRIASAQVARGEATAHDAALLDAINHRAAALGVWP